MHEYMNEPYYLLSLAMAGSRNSRWRTSKPVIPACQLVNELVTRFQIIIPRFWGREIQWCHFQHCHTTTAVGIQDGGRQNRKCLYFSLWGASNAISSHNTTFSGSGNSRHSQHGHTTTEVEIRDERHNEVRSYNSALTQSDEKISMIIGTLFP